MYNMSYDNEKTAGLLHRATSGMTTSQLRKELIYWEEAETAGPKTQGLVDRRIKAIKKEIETR